MLSLFFFFSKFKIIKMNTNIELSKQSHVTDFFKSLDKNTADVQKILDLRLELERKLKMEGCASYRDLAEK